nr:hypothetical protein [Spirosomataceae bacterium]
MNQLKKIISNVSWQLFTSDFLKCLLAMLSVGILVFGFTHSVFWSLFLGCLTFIFIAYQTQLFRNRQPQAIEVIHQKLNAEQLQIERLLSQTQSLQVPTLWNKNLHFYGLALLLSLCAYALLPFVKFGKDSNITTANNPNAEILKQNLIPKFQSAILTVTPPAYTNLPQKSGSEL